MSVKQIGNGCPYKASITREPFLFYEMRTTAKLMMDGLSDDEIVQRIVAENLFQYPTERSVKRMANACVKRLRGMDDMTLVNVIATKPMDVSRQVCLYAMMKQYRLVWDFMITVIGEKLSLRCSTPSMQTHMSSPIPGERILFSYLFYNLHRFDMHYPLQILIKLP